MRRRAVGRRGAEVCPSILTDGIFHVSVGRMISLGEERFGCGRLPILKLDIRCGSQVLGDLAAGEDEESLI